MLRRQGNEPGVGGGGDFGAQMHMWELSMRAGCDRITKGLRETGRGRGLDLGMLA